MNQKEWRKARYSIKEGDRTSFFYFRNLASELLGLRKGYVIHHLRDSEEARVFNDTYYERWGIDFDGVCRYCILMTEDEHRKYHSFSEETRKKIGESNRITKAKKEYKDKVSGKNSYMYGKKKEFTDDQKKRMSDKRKLYLADPEHRKQLSESRLMYFKEHPLTEDQKKIISEKTREAMKDPKIREKCSKARKGKPGNHKGKTLSDESRKKISESNFSRKASILYKEYKNLGGSLSWNQWQKAHYPEHD